MKRKKTPPSPPIPDWIPIREWDGFLAMRRQIKKPMTDLAVERAITTLAKLRDEGHAPADVLSQSIFHCWQKLLPIKPDDDYPSRSAPQPERPIKYHVEPPDSPLWAAQREREKRIREIFGGPPAAPEPGSGDVGPGKLSSG